MAFPTTTMHGYTDLRERIALALGRCQEQPWLDFKESQPWSVLKWRLLKTIMAMANLRDGGLILIGVAERGTDWDLKGIDPTHLTTYDFDEIVDQISKYASPKINLDVVIHEDEEGKKFLAFHVHQFRGTPIVCRNSSPDDLKPKERLLAGDVYVRPEIGKPQTAKVTDATRLHDLLELAAEFRARRLLEVSKRVGLVPIQLADKMYDKELTSLLTQPIRIAELPHWQVLIRPTEYQENLIPSLGQCVKLIEKTRVRFRGWDFPHLPKDSHTEDVLQRGSNWIGSFVNFIGIEFWQLFQSGQFIHLSALREETQSEWKDELRRTAMGHLHHRHDIDWNSVRGYVSLVNMIYNVTEYFEFAARVSQAGVYKGELQISVSLSNVRDFVLTTDSNRMWTRYYVANQDSFSKTWILTTENLIAGSLDHSLKAVAWLCECFGWISPNEESIRMDQQRLVSRKM